MNLIDLLTLYLSYPLEFLTESLFLVTPLSTLTSSNKIPASLITFSSAYISALNLIPIAIASEGLESILNFCHHNQFQF